MPHKDPEKKREYFRKYKRVWRERNRERWLNYIRDWQRKNRNKIRTYSRKHYWRHREKEIIRVMEGNKRRYRRQRLEVLIHYGAKCACCGEERIYFLGIDHINGGGTAHRKELWKKHQNIYTFLIKSKFPTEYRILCHNCNLSLGFYGFCPHQIERGELTEKDLAKIEYEKSLSRRKNDRITSESNTRRFEEIF
jgi:hypothetical protein